MLVLASTGAERLETAGFIIINAEKKHDIRTKKQIAQLFYYDFMIVNVYFCFMFSIALCIYTISLLF